MKSLLSRRQTVLGLITVATASVIARFTRSKIKCHYKVAWKQLSDELIGPGDMWASSDPNTPERQDGSDYSLQMQAVNQRNYGTPAKEIGIGNGAFWRPIEIVAC